jgi:hypothetical protein
LTNPVLRHWIKQTENSVTRITPTQTIILTKTDPATKLTNHTDGKWQRSIAQQTLQHQNRANINQATDTNAIENNFTPKPNHLAGGTHYSIEL